MTILLSNCVYLYKYIYFFFNFWTMFIVFRFQSHLTRRSKPLVNWPHLVKTDLSFYLAIQYDPVELVTFILQFLWLWRAVVLTYQEHLGVTYLTLTEDPSPRVIIRNRCTVALLMKENIKGTDCMLTQLFSSTLQLLSLKSLLFVNKPLPINVLVVAMLH